MVISLTQNTHNLYFLNKCLSTHHNQSINPFHPQWRTSLLFGITQIDLLNCIISTIMTMFTKRYTWGNATSNCLFLITLILISTITYLQFFKIFLITRKTSVIQHIKIWFVEQGEKNFFHIFWKNQIRIELRTRERFYSDFLFFLLCRREQKVGSLWVRLWQFYTWCLPMQWMYQFQLFGGRVRALLVDWPFAGFRRKWMNFRSSRGQPQEFARCCPGYTNGEIIFKLRTAGVKKSACERSLKSNALSTLDSEVSGWARCVASIPWLNWLEKSSRRLELPTKKLSLSPSSIKWGERDPNHFPASCSRKRFQIQNEYRDSDCDSARHGERTRGQPTW